MIGRFPWDPFPSGEPDPKGPDPIHGALYRAAVQGGDAYRAVRSVVRRERGVLRVGNRFVPEGRYREVGFVSLGHAAPSMALAALDALGERLTQGYVAGPTAPPDYLPFRSTVVADGWGGDPSARDVLEATREIALTLKETDLLLVLVSPGAIRTVALPPEGMTPGEFGDRLRQARELGATGPELELLARVLGTGGVAGRLLPFEVTCDVQTLIVDRGDRPALVGGGPTVALGPTEVEQARAVLARLGLDRAVPLPRPGPAEPLPSRTAAKLRRPVVITGPSEALRSATDVAFEKGWTTRVGYLLLRDRPEEAADRLLEKVETLIEADRRGGPSGSKGLVVLAMATLDVPEGVAEDGACRQFVDRARTTLRRRELSVGLYRTVGQIGPPGTATTPAPFGGAVVGAATDPEATVPPGVQRALRMRAAITDVGVLAVAVLPRSPGSTGTGS